MLVINPIPIQLRSQQENERVIRQTPLQVKFKIPSLHDVNKSYAYMTKKLKSLEL